MKFRYSTCPLGCGPERAASSTSSSYASTCILDIAPLTDDTRIIGLAVGIWPPRNFAP
ncbi:hypothetical protein lerEdw1_015617 [Lerista edwardsae]|nr:hypothetical protein lerEdw1_015617 [Lerista edwardsae]